MASFAGSSPTRGGRLIADACDQQPIMHVEWGLRVVLSRHFWTSLHVGHARRKQASINVQEYLPEAQNKQTNSAHRIIEPSASPAEN